VSQNRMEKWCQCVYVWQNRKGRQESSYNERPDLQFGSMRETDETDETPHCLHEIPIPENSSDKELISII
jgi:hypothetical protein